MPHFPAASWLSFPPALLPLLTNLLLFCIPLQGDGSLFLAPTHAQPHDREGAASKGDHDVENTCVALDEVFALLLRLDDHAKEAGYCPLFLVAIDGRSDSQSELSELIFSGERHPSATRCVYYSHAFTHIGKISGAQLGLLPSCEMYGGARAPSLPLVGAIAMCTTRPSPPVSSRTRALPSRASPTPRLTRPACGGAGPGVWRRS